MRHFLGVLISIGGFALGVYLIWRANPRVFASSIGRIAGAVRSCLALAKALRRWCASRLPAELMREGFGKGATAKGVVFLVLVAAVDLVCIRVSNVGWDGTHPGIRFELWGVPSMITGLPSMAVLSALAAGGVVRRAVKRVGSKDGLDARDIHDALALPALALGFVAVALVDSLAFAGDALSIRMGMGSPPLITHLEDLASGFGWYAVLLVLRIHCRTWSEVFTRAFTIMAAFWVAGIAMRFGMIPVRLSLKAMLGDNLGRAVASALPHLAWTVIYLLAACEAWAWSEARAGRGPGAQA